MKMAMSPRDQALLEGAAAGKSAEELGRIVNVPAANAVLRVQELLRDRDVWSGLERRQLLLQDLYKLKSSLQTQVENGGFEPKDVANLLKAFQQIGNILESSSKITNSQLERVTSVQAAVLYDMVLNSFVRVKQALVAQFPDADMSALDDLFVQGLRESQTRAVGA